MAKEVTKEAVSADAEKKRLQNEKKQLKKEQKQQKKEAKRRAKEISRQEEELGLDEGGNGLVTFGATLFIVVLWIVVVCIIVKLDIGGFGSSVLTPILKDVPVLNKILPGVSVTETTDPESYGGYSSLPEAVNYIKQLELELEQVRAGSSAKDADIQKLIAENKRLSEFEERQVEFQRIRTEFYEEVIYAENGPGAEDYRKWYEEMNPETAEYLYKQVVIQEQASKAVQDWAQAYAEMKPKEAAAIFDTMTDNLELVAKILKSMDAESRGNILAQMNAENAARLTKIMAPTP
ncbi:MAG: MotE family protein [Acetatifactor sp.]